ncbi:MAG: class I fructose-bisphosphate aldolase [Candidatus Pacearchaeota archaeon]
MASIKPITRKGKALILAYDQGMEHGPEEDFNEKNVSPSYIIDIAKKARPTAIALGKGIAEKYKKEIRKSKIPLIVKLNGKTSLYNGEPISRPTGTVEEALKLNAKAVGYTIYIGSQHESEMFRDFSRIQKKAHENNLPVVLWVYPRGKAVKNEKSRKNLSYASRVGLELGADIVKVKYNGKPKDLEWVSKAAGKTKVVIAGGTKSKEKEFLNQVEAITKSGAIGMAIGRNIWQNKDPVKITEKIKKRIWKE